MNDLVGPLCQNLEQEVQVVDALLGLIQNEQHLLVHAQLANMRAIIDQKARHIARLAELASQRHIMLAEAGFPSNEDGMQDLLQQQPDEPVAQLWQQLLKQVESAQRLNNTNGLLINSQLGRFRSALNVLSGHNNDIYGPDGQTSHVTRAPRGFVSS